jgi:hypothetical protein
MGGIREDELGSENEGKKSGKKRPNSQNPHFNPNKYIKSPKDITSIIRTYT